MSREDATYFFFEKWLDPDTDLGVSVTSEIEIIGVVATNILVSRSNFFSKKIGGDVSCIRRIYWSKGFSVKGPSAELLAIKVSLVENQ